MEQVVGPYQILGKLGAGGMGEVYKALDSRVGRHVALKILPESLALDPDRRRRFEQEARLAASLNHPNVMAIYDVGLDQHPPYIVGELVPGESLRGMMSKGAIAPRKAIDIAAQIAAGLAAAHAAGIVHRDLKPENVIVTPDSTAKILDFGVARLESKAPAASDATVAMGSTALGAVVGTAAYMSPEQARALDVDNRSDQFSLGLVLYEMLTGKPAFQEPSAVQTMAAIVEKDPPPVERGLPVALRNILERCLAKERADRYESTRDLARELAQLRDHYGEFTTQTGVQPAVIGPRKRPAIGTVGAAAAAIAVLLGLWAVRPTDRHRIDLARYSLTPFATMLPYQAWPSWSPDGKSLAFFGAAETGPQQLFVQALDAPTAVAIAGGNGVDLHSWYHPFWSADSRAVYFRCSRGSDEGLCRAPVSGGETVVVQRNTLASALSPDGRTLAMLAYRQDSGFRLQLMIASPPEAAPHPYEPAPFTPGIHYNNPSISFSPDGKQILIAIAFQDRGETTYLAPWPPGKARPLFAHAPEFSFTPEFSWLPDSRYVVFSSATGSHHSQLDMADVHDGSYWPIFVEDRGAASPTVSPDGSRLAYESGLSQADVIAVPLGEGPVRTLLGSFRTEQMAGVSPVSQQLVYVTNRRGVEEVWITSLAEGWDRPLFTPRTFQVQGSPAQLFFTPVFSPDGRRVALAAKGIGQIHVYTAFTSGGEAVRATSGQTGLETAPAWSPDGKWIAYVRVVGDALKLSKVQPGSGEPPVDIGAVDSNPVPVWSPNGDWIAAMGADDKLTLFSPDGKTSRKLPSGDQGPLAWSRDGKTLYHLTLDPPALVAIDVATGSQKKLRDLVGLMPYAGMNPGLCAGLTPDGKDIVYTVNRVRHEIWILDGLQEPPAWYRRIFGR